MAAALRLEAVAVMSDDRAVGRLDPATDESATDRPSAGGATARATLTGVVEALVERPSAFSFFQAVTLLERIHADRKRVGFPGAAATESIRFRGNPSLASVPAPIHTIASADEGPATMTVNFMGLIGEAGVLPYEYTALVEERNREGDTALGDFLDLFHHRWVSLFYRAWYKYRFGTQLERDGASLLARHVEDLVGTGQDSLSEKVPFERSALRFHAGLLARLPRSAVALEQWLEGFFEVPVEVQQFSGGWYGVAGGDQVTLDDGAPSRLGEGLVVGDEVWDPQASVRIRLGPLSWEQYSEFLPTGRAYGELKRLLRFFAHDQFDFEIQLVLDREQVPGCVLGADDEGGQPLGWSTWLQARRFTRDPAETVLAV